MKSICSLGLTSLKENWAQYLQVIATVVLVVWMGLFGLAFAILLYVLLSFIKREQPEY